MERTLGGKILNYEAQVLLFQACTSIGYVFDADTFPVWHRYSYLCILEIVSLSFDEPDVEKKFCADDAENEIAETIIT